MTKHAIVVKNNMPDVILSVSQIFASGDNNKENITIFTADGVRVFDFDSV